MLVVPSLGTLLLLLQFPRTTAAQGWVQSTLWKTPDGKSGDLTQTFIVGQTIPLSWGNWSTTQYLDAISNKVDLWVTTFEYNIYQFSRLLKTSIDLSTNGNYAWTIDIPNEYLSVTPKYVLRFKIPADSYNANTADLSSPGFLVIKGIASTSDLVSTSIPTTSIRSETRIESAAPTLDPSTTTSTSTTLKSEGISPGAKAGVGIGVTAGIMGVVGLVLYFLFKRKKKETPNPSTVDKKVADPNCDSNLKFNSMTEPQELPDQPREDSHPKELYGSDAQR